MTQAKYGKAFLIFLTLELPACLVSPFYFPIFLGDNPRRVGGGAAPFARAAQHHRSVFCVLVFHIGLIILAASRHRQSRIKQSRAQASGSITCQPFACRRCCASATLLRVST